MAACSCPTPLGLCVPFDMDDIILSFVDEVCLPLNRVNLARYLPVLPSFLELSRTLPASALEDGIVGAFQPSSFVLQGLGSSLTRQVALQYLDVARHHHGKMEIEDESKIFFHGFKTRFIVAGNCAIDQLESTIEELKALDLDSFDVSLRINEILHRRQHEHGGREGGGEGEDGGEGGEEGGNPPTPATPTQTPATSTPATSSPTPATTTPGRKGGEGCGVGGGAGVGEGGGKGVGGGVGQGFGGTEADGEGKGVEMEAEESKESARMTAHELAQRMGPGEFGYYDECCVFLDKMSCFVWHFYGFYNRLS